MTSVLVMFYILGWEFYILTRCCRFTYLWTVCVCKGVLLYPVHGPENISFESN